MRTLARILAVSAIFALPAASVRADDYPSRTVHVIASQGAGGLSDIFMRALAQKLEPILHATIVVENHTGAGGSIGAHVCADAAPDGYTICIIPAEAMVINPLIYPNAGFDPKKALLPITKLFYITQVFAVNASLHVKTFPQLAALARAKPKTMNYMAPSLSKVAFMERFNKDNHTDFVRIPFKGGGDAVNNMLSGTTPVAIFGIGNLIPFLRNGSIVALAVDGDKRSPLAPDVPTFPELGYTHHVMASYFGLYAPAGTPKAIIDKLNKAVVKAASDPQFQKRQMINRGLAPVLDTPEQFAKELVADRTEGRSVVKESGLYPNFK